jgi:hypothetical protein
VQFKVSAGGRERSYRMTVAEPEPGRVITESDSNSSLVTTFTVTPQGANSRVRIFTSWDGAGGIGGFFERRFAPRAMQKIYLDELARLNAYALQRATAWLRRLNFSLRLGRPAQPVCRESPGEVGCRCVGLGRCARAWSGRQ